MLGLRRGGISGASLASPSVFLFRAFSSFGFYVLTFKSSRDARHDPRLDDVFAPLLRCHSS